MASDASDGIDHAVTMASTSTSAPGTPPASTTEKDEPKASFTTLPEELVSNVAVKLGSDDHFNLRLTCKDLEAKSLHEFATEYFSKKAFMFTSESLKALVSISKSDKFRHYLREIFIITARVTENHVKCCQYGKSHWHPTVRQREAFLLYQADQKTLQKRGRDLKLLSGAFARLPRVESLCLADHPSKAAKDYEHQQPAKCMGLTKFERTTGMCPPFWPTDGSASLVAEHDRWLTHLFQTILSAVASSGIAPTHVGTYLHSSYGLSPVTDLKMTTKTADLLAKALHNTTRLDLTLRSRYFRVGKQDSTRDVERATRNIERFAAAAAAGLTQLSLNFDFGDSSAPLSRVLMNNIDLGKLTHFRLNHVLVDMSALAAAICHLKSAETVELLLVEIQGSWVPILKALQKLPRLTHLHMNYLQADGQKCYFLEKPDEGHDEDDLGYDLEVDLPVPGSFNPLTGQTVGANGADDQGSEWSDSDGDSEYSDDDESVPSLTDRHDAATAREDADVGDFLNDAMSEGSDMDDEGSRSSEEDADSEDQDDDINEDDDIDQDDAIDQDDDDSVNDSLADLPSGKDWPGAQPDTGGSAEQAKKEKSGKRCSNRTPHHRAPKNDVRRMGSERGYYICLEGAEIQEQLPTFMKEYNLGGDPLGLNGMNGLLANIAAQLPPGVGGMGGGVGGTFTIPIPLPPATGGAPTPGAGVAAAGPPLAPGQGQPGNQPAGPPAPFSFAGLMSFLGGPLPPPPPPPPAAPPAAAPPTTAQPGQTQTDNATAPTALTAATNTTSGAADDQHEEDWWNNDEPAQGDLDDVD